MAVWSLLLLLALLKFNCIRSIEFTFELYNNGQDCFYEVIEKNVSTTLKYQVIAGGQYHVDITIEGPHGDILYQQYKSQYDSHTFVPAVSGVYAVCFSYEFSMFSHKIVYMNFQVGDEQPLPGIGGRITVMTLTESYLQEIHRKLNTINDLQKHHKPWVTSSRKRAEDLNRTVFWWCFTKTVLVLCTMIGQVLFVINLFSYGKNGK